MMVTGCGVWVTHAHASGGVPHVHGWGLNLGKCPVCGGARSDGPSPCHRHLLVFGVECPNEPVGDSTPPDLNPVVALIDQCEAPSAAEPPAAPPPLFAAPTVTLTTNDAGTAGISRDRHPVSVLPPFALRHVSGVLRS